MRKRKGWKRLGIALGLPYFGLWAVIIVGNIVNFRKAAAQQDSAWMDLTVGNILIAILWGIVIPAIVLIVWAAGRWVYRGFKSDQASET